MASKESHETRHPEFSEALILVGAAIAFTLDNWDEFMRESEIEKEGAEEIKALYVHYMNDVHAEQKRQKLLETAFKMFKGEYELS